MVWKPVTGKILETSSEENRPQVPLKANLSSASGRPLCCKTRRQWTLYIYIIWLKEAPTDFWSYTIPEDLQIRLTRMTSWWQGWHHGDKWTSMTSEHQCRLLPSKMPDWARLPISAELKTFLLVPLSWQWLGKIIPSATTSGPLLRKVIFRIYKTFLFQARGGKINWLLALKRQMKQLLQMNLFTMPPWWQDLFFGWLSSPWAMKA